MKTCDTCDWLIGIIEIYRASLLAVRIDNVEQLSHLSERISLLEEELAIHRAQHRKWWMREPWIELVPSYQIGVN